MVLPVRDVLTERATAGNFLPAFSIYAPSDWTAVSRNYGTSPNPLAEVFDVIVRSYRPEVGYDRGQGRPRFRTIQV
jgi:hypothetical protein